MAEVVRRRLGSNGKVPMAVKTELAQDVLEALQPHSDALDRLARFTAREWQAAYFWLDSHGITLTLADRLRANPAAKIPAPVRARFEANLRDNADRCRDMLEHFAAVNRRLESAGVVFAVEKGFALCPEYWTEPALRLQLDLDYLIEPGAAPVVARLLAEFGYQRTPRAEREWGFETAPGAVLPHDALYQPSASGKSSITASRPGKGLRAASTNRRSPCVCAGSMESPST